MMLLIDIGNTNTVCALYDGKSYVMNQRILPNENIQSVLIDKLFDEGMISSSNSAYGNLNHIAISSVVPKMTDIYWKLFMKNYNIDSFIISHENAGVTLKVDSSQEVGNDRICNVRAANELTQKNCLVIDFGTATTYDVINNKQEFIGGAIAPGIEVSALYLIKKAALLKNTILKFPKNYIGQSTETNIQSGIMYSAVHSIEGMVQNIKKEINGKVDIILTGGFSQLISQKLSFKHSLNINLTIEGIRLIHEENLNE